MKNLLIPFGWVLALVLLLGSVSTLEAQAPYRKNRGNTSSSPTTERRDNPAPTARKSAERQPQIERPTQTERRSDERPQTERRPNRTRLEDIILQRRSEGKQRTSTRRSPLEDILFPQRGSQQRQGNNRGKSCENQRGRKVGHQVGRGKGHAKHGHTIYRRPKKDDDDDDRR